MGMAVPRRLLLLPVVLLVAAAGLLPLSPATAKAAKKVSLELYYETLCPYCSRFIVKYLAGIFKDGLIDAVDLRLVPYGNARVESNGDISCQHGPDECMLNTVEACAIEAWTDLDVHFPFIYCVENLVVKGEYNKWASCFHKLGLDTKPIVECYNGGQGYKLDLKYANQTGALVPPQRYVPWVVVDGQPLLEDYKNFEAYVCKAYRGTPPKVCQGLLHPAKARSGVTYKSGGIKLARHL